MDLREKMFRFVALGATVFAGLFFDSCDLLDPSGGDENQAPVVTLKGDAVDTIGIGHSYIDSGATATDAEDGDLTSSITVSGTVDTGAVGVYTLTYSVQDSEGESASAQRIVHVVDNSIILSTPTCPAVYDCTSVSYKITSTFTIPEGCSVTFGPNTRVEMQRDVVVDGELTIQQGARFLVDEDAILHVKNGKLTIAGADTAKVRFENSTAGTYWGRGEDASGSYARYGIKFGTTANATSSIGHCVFDSATVGIRVEKDGITITNSTFSNCAYAGLYFDGAGPKDSASFVNNTFTANGKSATYFPLYIDATYLARLSGTSVFNGNAHDAVAVNSGADISETGSWKKLGVPYVFQDYTNIDNSNGVIITIRPGARFEFLEESYLAVKQATLIAEGTAGDSIVFDNFEAGKYWGHGDDNSGWYARYSLRIDNTANANTSLKYCRFDSATVGIYCERDDITISNCNFTNCAYAGLYFASCGPQDSASFLNNSFEGNGKSATFFPMYIDATYLSCLSGTSVFNGNAVDAVAVEGEDITESGTWKKLEVPYVFRDHGAIDNSNGVTITIQPGTVLQFLDDTYLGVSHGTLMAVGTAADSIYFTNYVAGTFWGHGDPNSGMYANYGIKFSSTANPNSTLQYCSFDSAVVAVNIDEAAVHVSNCTIRDCQLNGMYTYGAGNTNVDTTTIVFANNGASPAHLHEE